MTFEEDFCQEIISLLSHYRLPLTVEKETQAAIERIFIDNNIPHNREYYLDKENIVDFFISNGVAIEIKIKGNAKKIYKQCERYCQFEQVKLLILITNRSMGFPKEINNKPCYFLKLGEAWL